MESIRNLFMKPIITQKSNNSYKYNLCPICLSKLTFEQKYCIICGQKIKWDNEWHNLKKDPKDLPEEFKYVYCIDNKYRHRIYKAEHIGHCVNGDSVDIWLDEDGFSLEACAWKYIEEDKV